MAFHLIHTLKALLFSTSEPISVKDIQALITRWHEENEAASDPVTTPNGTEPAEAPEAVDPEGQALLGPILDEVPSLLTATQIREALATLQRQLEESDEVYRLKEAAQGWQIVVHPHYADWVRLLRGEPRPRRLSRPVLETLAIVAYRQPVTRAEIEAIRGVSADNALQRLQDQGFIQVTGTAELPGRPRQYGTTEAFLAFAGLRSLEELPSSDILAPEQISAWVRRQVTEPAPADELENTPPATAQVGLPVT